MAAVQRGEMTVHKALCIAGELPKLSPYDKLLLPWNWRPPSTVAA